MDNEDLSDDHLGFLVCIRTAKLPVRIGEHRWIEPYFPNRFARQFGYDQGVPANKLTFGVSSRRNCSFGDMFEAQAMLSRWNTGSLFYVPCSTYQGTCTYWYCKWWRTSSATYLGTSLAALYTTFNKRPLDKKTIFTMSVLKEISSGIRKEILLSDMGIEKSSSLQPVGQSSGLSKNKNTMAHRKCKTIPESSSPGSSLGSSHDVHFKRARYEKPDDCSGVDIGTTVAADAGNFTPKVESKNLGVPSLYEKRKSVACVPDEVVSSSLHEVKTSIHVLFGSEVSNFRQGYIIGEVENIFVKLSSYNSPAEMLACREEVNMVLDILVPIINILESGRTELEWFVKTVRHIFLCASQICDNAKIIDQGNQIRDLLQRHDECLSTKKAFETELANSIQELKRIEAELLPVKEAEEVARVLRQQYDSGRLVVRRRVSDLKASIEQQKKLDVEFRQSRVDANEGLLSDVECAEALNKSAEEKIFNSVASLLYFCSKSE